MLFFKKSVKPSVQRLHNYSQIHHEIRTGDVLLWRTYRVTSLTSFVNYWYQILRGKSYSRIAIALRYGSQVYAVESVSPQVSLMPLRMLDDFFWIRTKIVNKRTLYKTLERHLGSPVTEFDRIRAMLMQEDLKTGLYDAEMAWEFLSSVGFFSGSKTRRGKHVISPDEVALLVLAQNNGVTEFVRIDKGNL